MVVPKRSPLVAWASPAMGFSPSAHRLWEQKLYRVAKVCADRTVAVVAHRTKTALALLPQLSLPSTLAIRFIDAILLWAVFPWFTIYHERPLPGRRTVRHPPCCCQLPIIRRHVHSSSPWPLKTS